jgi:GNAT superfamily N-acetyltransferase
LIAELEAIARDAWPARECELYDGWILAESGGYSRRANSAQPVERGVLDLDAKIAYCARFFAARDRRLVFKLTDDKVCDGLDGAFGERGFVRTDPTSVQGLGLDPDRGWKCDEEVRIDPTLEDDWFATCISLGSHSDELVVSLNGILQRASSGPGASAFASLSLQKRMVSQGLGVLRESTLFLCELVSDPKARRGGLARRIVNSLLAWGRDNGADRAILQVVVDNVPAQALYADLGFEEVYRYWYREVSEG